MALCGHKFEASLFKSENNVANAGSEVAEPIGRQLNGISIEQPHYSFGAVKLEESRKLV